MKSYKYVIQLPPNKTLEQVFTDMNDIVENFSVLFATMKSYSVNNGCNITRNFDESTNTVTLIYEWPDQESVDKFYEYVNVVFDYNEFLNSYKTYLQENGGNFTKIDIV